MKFDELSTLMKHLDNAKVVFHLESSGGKMIIGIDASDREHGEQK